ncbi:MAG: hypothetical protein JWN98_495 [Abditibacteriota bacterium]|nr:hypothetical protein [Abditibacteriota bacterium]
MAGCGDALFLCRSGAVAGDRAGGGFAFSPGHSLFTFCRHRHIPRLLEGHAGGSVASGAGDNAGCPALLAVDGGHQRFCPALAAHRYPLATAFRDALGQFAGRLTQR